jgi:hypothetical protein
MKTKLFTVVLCSLMLLGLGCSSENEPNVSDKGKEQPVNLQEEEPDVPKEDASSISGIWKVKALSISGELTNIGSPPDDVSNPNISIEIPDTAQGTIYGHTFRNAISIEFEIGEHQQISFTNYGSTRSVEDEWGTAFSHIMSKSVVKFEISNNELTFADSQNNPIIIFLKKN